MSGQGSATSSSKNSSSLSGFLSTLIPVGLQAAAFIALFLIFRTKLKRVYRPRTYLNTLYDGEKTEDPPSGRFNWLKPWRSLPDEYVLNHSSLDGYLYLRFLKMLTIICFFGSVLTFIILFPVNATAGGGETQFDLLSFSNIPKTQKNRYYAHVFVGWIFFSGVMYYITRETIYFINLRHAYLLSPFNAAKISSRTVLFTDVPVEYINQEKLQALFGNTIVRTWLAPDCKELEKKVEERDKDAYKLESAEIKLIQTANKRRLKHEKRAAKAAAKNKPVDDTTAIAGSQYMKPKDRPMHKLGKIPCIGKKVDTINWTRSELRRLVPEVEKDQLAHQKYSGKLLPAVFVEFVNQQSAQAAYRRMNPKKSPKMNPRAIDMPPSDVIWGNLKIKKTERLGRKFLTNTFLTLMIIFWAIPVAVVGAISNINYLTDKVHFLSFINHIPAVILGVVTGLLPSVMLSILMALVPVVCRWMSKLSGEVTLSRVELRCQAWYMAFQVVQVFLITTFASGAASVVTDIIKTPSSATGLLAQSLPKASNFFISYIIVQGLGIAAGNLLNIGSLVMLTVVGKFLDKSPRKIFKRYITLAGLGWGSLYPQFGNLGIIAISYSIIAPLVMGFATIGFGIVYLAVRYNTFFVLTNNIDTKGLAYARALQQLMTGVYLAEVCLIGLFAINTAPGPIVLMVIFLIGTAIYHAMMRHALKPLMHYLPDSYDGDSSDLFHHAEFRSYDAEKAGSPPSALESMKPGKFKAHKASFLQKLFDPKKFSSHTTVRNVVPNWPAPQYLEEEEQLAYFNPAMYAPVPKLWIVRDTMGISRKEVQDSSEVVPITDEYSTFNEKGKVIWDHDVEDGGSLKDMPVWDKRVDY